MGFIRRGLHVVAVATGTLLVTALVCIAVLAIASLAWPGSGPIQPKQYLLLFSATVAFTMLIGIPAIAIVALIYATLDRFGQARWYFVIPLALVPGLVMLHWDQAIGLTSLVAGAFVGAVTHSTMTRWNRQPGPKVVV